MSLEIYASLKPKLDLYKYNPVAFAKDVFGVILDEWQEEMLCNINDNQKVAVAGATGLGKGFASALAIWWFITTKTEIIDGQLKFPKLMVTGPEEKVLKNGVWAQLSELYRKAPLMQLLFKITAEKIYMKGTEREWFCVLKTTSARYSGSGDAQAESLQGFHAVWTLVLIDEGCHDDQTEVLTDQGWMLFKDIPNCKVKPKILSMDRETGIADYYEYNSYIEFPYEGNLFSYNKRGGNFRITPDHNIFYRTGNPRSTTGKSKFKYNKIKHINNNKIYIPKHFIWERQDQEYFILPEFNTKRKSRPDRYLKMDDWVDLLGWFCSEGSIGTEKNGIKYSFVISQKNKDNQVIIKNLLNRMNLKWKLYNNNFHICDAQLTNYFSKLGTSCLTRKLPRFLFDLSSRQIEIFINSFYLGDGYLHKNNRIIYTSNKSIADDIQVLINKTGKYATIKKRKLKNKTNWIIDHFATSSVDGWVIIESNRKTDLSVKNNDLKQEYYKGNVYCLTVAPHHLLYTRRNGYCMWSGNSGLARANLEALLGSAINEQRKIVMTFNPLRDDGYPYQIYNDKRYGDAWKTMNVSFYDVPRLCNDQKQREERESWIKMYGLNSAYVQARVFGNFPTAATTNRVFSQQEIMDARERNDKVEDDDTQLTQIGVDISRFGGDETVYYVRRGLKSLEMLCEAKTSQPQVVARCIELAEKWCPKGKEPKKHVVFVIDEVGMGAGPVDYLLEQGWVVAGVHNGSSPTMPEEYRILIDELWMEDGKDAIKHCGLIDDDILANQLLSRTYCFTGKAKQRRISTKDEMKAKKLDSPDRADAFILAFTNPDKLHLRSTNIRDTIDFF